MPRSEVSIASVFFVHFDPKLNLCLYAGIQCLSVIYAHINLKPNIVLCMQIQGLTMVCGHKCKT
jgi:hypothetical protein